MSALPNYVRKDICQLSMYVCTHILRNLHVLLPGSLFFATAIAPLNATRRGANSGLPVVCSYFIFGRGVWTIKSFT